MNNGSASGSRGLGCASEVPSQGRLLSPALRSFEFEALGLQEKSPGHRWPGKGRVPMVPARSHHGGSLRPRETATHCAQQLLLTYFQMNVT